MTSFQASIENEQVYRLLEEKLSRNELILFAGSGLSAQACTDRGEHPPNWTGLLYRMVDWAQSHQIIEEDQQKEIIQLISGNYFLDAGQELQEVLEQQLGPCLYDTLLFKFAKTGEAHELIAQLPFRGYLTTNYDDLIEGAFYAQHKKQLIKIYENGIGDLAGHYHDGNPFIVKMHGDVSTPGTIVLGNRSYERLLYTGGVYRDALAAVLAGSSALFLGYGAGDPDIEALTTMVARFTSRPRKHWILLPKGTFPPLKAKRLSKDRGILVIEYPSDGAHSGVVTFLRRLAECDGDRTGSPPGPASKPLQRSTKIENIEAPR